MTKNRFLCIFASLFIFFGFIFSACSQAEMVPDPETVSGVYVHAGYEYYQWEEGLRVMIWHGGVNHLNCSSFTNGQYETECQGEAVGNHTVTWRLETKDGETAKFTISGKLFDLSAGKLFVIQSSSGDLDVKQLKRDLSDVQADAGSVTEFGLSDPTILAFIQTSSEIGERLSDCVSSTAPEDDSALADFESAQQTLISFFSLLNDGEYKRAAALYGGMYHSLQDLNPKVDPNDHAALFKNVCTVNGAQCLEVRQSTLLDQPTPADFRFSVEFSNEDGSLFSRGPCCGDDSNSNDAQTAFIYTVRLACTGDYQVLGLPVFSP